MTFTTYEYIWAVVCTSTNDCYEFIDSYWSDPVKANKKAEQIKISDNGKHYGKVDVRQKELLRDNEGIYYKYCTEEVIVDPPTKEEVLAKLTPKERKVLGV